METKHYYLIGFIVVVGSYLGYKYYQYKKERKAFLSSLKYGQKVKISHNNDVFAATITGVYHSTKMVATNTGFYSFKQVLTQ